MYPEQPEATAVAVMEGRIVGVGSRESLRDDLACLSGTRVLEDAIFSDKVLMPGIVEAHTHLVIPALEYANHFVPQIPWPDPKGGFFPTYAGKRDVLERLRELDAQLPAGELLWATHYDDNQAGGMLHRDELDAVSTRRPILVSNMVFHRFWANSCLLERAGVREGHVPPGAECDADGRPNGTLIEAPGFLLVSSAFPEIVNLTREKLENILPLFRAQGITTVSELVAGSRVALDREYAQFESLLAEPGRGLRCAVYPHVHRLVEREGSLEAAIARLEELSQRRSSRLWLAGAKLYHDGSIISHTCPLEWPGYWDGSGGKHMQHEPEEIRALLLALHERGIPCVTHTNTSLAVQTVLDAVEEAQSRCCRPDIRHRVEHCYTMTAAQLRRARALNVGVQFFTPVLLRGRAPAHRGPHTGGEPGADGDGRAAGRQLGHPQRSARHAAAAVAGRLGDGAAPDAWRQGAGRGAARPAGGGPAGHHAGSSLADAPGGQPRQHRIRQAGGFLRA